MALYSIAAHHFHANAALVRFVAIAIHGLLHNLFSSHATHDTGMVESLADCLLPLIAFTSSLLMLMRTR